MVITPLSEQYEIAFEWISILIPGGNVITLLIVSFNSFEERISSLAGTINCWRGATESIHSDFLAKHSN